MLFLTGCDGEADVVFAIDSSSLTNERDFRYARDFIRSVVLRLQIRQEKTRVGIIAIVEGGVYEMRLSEFVDRNLMVDFIDRISYRGGMIDFPQFINFTMSRVFTEPEGGRAVVPNVLVMVASDTAIYESRLVRAI